MRLLNSLYRIRKKAEEPCLRYDIQLDAGHFIYRAHFPGEPITPGVCIIQIAQELLEDWLGRCVRMLVIKNAKFLNVISPLATPTVSYVFEQIATDASNATCTVQARVTAGDVALAKLSFTCSLGMVSERRSNVCYD